MAVLVTGGSGLIGRALINELLDKGERVVSISRHPGPDGVYGDILQPNMGIARNLIWKDVDSVYHLAGIVNLAKRDKGGTIWETNVTGTRNVIEFCLAHNIPHLFYCSTAYTQGRNPYEKSKAEAEDMVRNSTIPRVTVFKPSIVIGTPDHLHLEHLPQFAMLLVRVHKRADLIRRKIEGSLHLPGLGPVFHLRGNPEGKLNIVPLDSVVKAMTKIQDDSTFWLTNPSPPTVQDVASWMGEAILLKLVVAPDFNATPIELAFERLTSAFSPYLSGYDFPSDLSCPIITRNIITSMVTQCLTS